MSLQIRLSAAQLASLTAVLLLAFAASLGMAFNIDAVVISFATSNTMAGLVASVEMAAIAAGNLTFARLAVKLPARQIYLAGILVVVTLNIISIMVPSPAWLIACRAPAGFALGAVVATVMTTAGRSDRPEQTFGVINSMVGVMGMFMAFVLPRALNLKDVVPVELSFSEVDGLYLVYALCSLCALFFIRGTPQAEPVEVMDGAAGSGGLLTGWLGLTGLGIIFFAHGTLALFIVKIGRAVPLSAEAIGYVFMAGSFAGVILPLITGYLGARMNAAPPIALILVVLMISALFLANASSPLMFFTAAPVFAMLPVAIMPIFLGCLSRLDPTGSLAGAHAAFVLIGGAIAPFAGGALSDFGGFSLNGWFAIGAMIAGACLAFPAIRKADRLRQVSTG